MKLHFINGNKFAWVGDFEISFDKPKMTMDIFKQDAIVFVKTDFIMQFFDFIKFSGRKYVLITQQSDYGITEKMFNARPPCIKKWFAQNTLYVHSDLIPIPIGIENH